MQFKWPLNPLDSTICIRPHIDLVLFVNGIPVATAELKSHYTQSVQDAIYQYKTDREPLFKPKNAPEPLLAFPGGALVHFAVSNAEAAMTTRLAGLDTVFLPFNQGNAGGAGNPPKDGIATDYLWKEVWQRDSFLQILGRYLVPVKNDKKQLIGWIFPRYHQLKVTRKLVAAVQRRRPRRQVSGAALGRLRQDQLHRLDARTSWPICTTRRTRRSSTPSS